MQISKCRRLLGMLTVYLLPILVTAQQQIVLWPELTGKALLDSVVKNYKPTKTLGYDKARDTMYKVIDLKPGNQLTCVYTGYTITLDLTKDPSTDAYNKNINCEHTWPQSLGAKYEPQLSDLHHLYPVYEPVNSSRGNDPFAEIPDQNTDKWYRLTEARTTIPPANIINEYSEKENDAPLCFEPREDHKGNVARSMFYFYAMYCSAADSNFWHIQKNTFLQWNYYDPVDLAEYNRTWKIASYQSNKPNPFVLDSTLARRIWFYKPTTIAATKPTVAQQFEVYAPFPNPFNAVTHLRFFLPVSTWTTVNLYDLKGRLVETLANEILPGGYHLLIWEASAYPAGIYFYQVTTDQQSQSGKIVLLK